MDNLVPIQPRAVPVVYLSHPSHQVAESVGDWHIRRRSADSCLDQISPANKNRCATQLNKSIFSE